MDILPNSKQLQFIQSLNINFKERYKFQREHQSIKSLRKYTETTHTYDDTLPFVHVLILPHTSLHTYILKLVFILDK